MVVSRDNALILTQPTWPLEDKLIRAWDGTTNQFLRTFDLGDLGREALSIALSSDGRLLTTGSDIYDFQTGDELRSLVDNQHFLFGKYTPSFSSDNQKLAAGSDKYSITIWDVETGELIHELETPTHYFHGGLAFSPDGQILVAGYPDGQTNSGGVVQVWNTETGENLYTLTGHSGRVTDVAFSPEGELLVSSSDGSNSARPQDGGMVRVWDIKPGRLLRSVNTPPIAQVDFTPDSKMLILEIWGSNTIQVWGVPPK